MKNKYRKDIIKQIHYDGYLLYRNLNTKLAISPLTLLVVDKEETILIFETEEEKSERQLSINIGYKKIVNYCFKTSPIKSIALDYATMIIDNELSNITTTCPNKHKLICQNKIIDQIATICGIKQGNLRQLPLNKLDNLANVWIDTILNNIDSEDCFYNNEIIFATLLLLKNVMHYLKYDTIYIVK